MLDLNIAGRQLLLPTKATATIEHINPLFADGLQDSHSVPIEVPADGNEATLQHVQEIGLAERILTFPQAQLGHQGLPLYTGLFQVLSSTARTIRGVFSVEAFVSRIRGRKLPELLEGHAIDASTDGILSYAANNAGLTYTDGAPCQFPMFFNKELYSGNNPDWFPNASTWSPTSTYTVNALVVYDELLPCLRQDIWQCTANTTAGQSPLSHPTKWRRTAFGIVNAWDAQNGEHYRNTSANFYALCPWFYLKWVLQQALNTIGYRPAGDFWEDPTTDELVLPNLTVLDAEKRLNYFRAEQTGSLSYQPPTPWNLFRVPADDDVNPPNTDPNDVWDPGNNTFTPNTAGNWRFRIRLNLVLSTPAQVQVYVRRANGGNYPGNWPFPSFLSPQDFTAFNQTVTFTMNFPAAEVGNAFHFSVYAGANFTAVWPSTTADTFERTMVSGWLTTGSALNTFRDTIEPADHVPDVQLESFLVAIAEALNLELTPDETSRTLRLDHRENLLLQRELNRTEQSQRCIEHQQTELDHPRRVQGIRLKWDMPQQELPDLRYYYLNDPVHCEEQLPPPDGPEQCAYVLNTRTIYLSELQPPSNWYWKPVGYNVAAVQVGSTTDTREIVPECTPLHMREVYLDGKRFLVPIMEGEGTSTYFNAAGDRSAIFLCEFLRHRSSDGQVTKVPCARSWTYGWEAGDDSRVSLLWDDEDPRTPGLYQRFWRNWASMLTTAEPVTMDLLVDAPFLRGREWRRILHIHGQDYLIEKMPVEYGADNGPLIARGTYMLRMRSNVVYASDRSKSLLRCGEPGTARITIAPDGVSAFEVGTDTNFSTFRLPDGSVVTMEKSSGELPRDTSLCLFASDAFGAPTGAITHLVFNGGVTSIDLSKLSQLSTLAVVRSGLTDITLPQVMQLSQLDLSGNMLPQPVIDRILGMLDPNVPNGYLDISEGDNAPPSSAGMALIIALQRNGWTVSYNK